MGLDTLSVLVCRPERAATPFCSKLEQLGARCYPVPALLIEPLQSEAQKRTIKSQLAALDHYQKVIFISQNAVQHAQPYLRAGRWPKCQLFAIGSATAKAAEQHGLTSIFGTNYSAEGAMSTEALLALPELADLTSQRLLIFRGRGGREALAQALRQRGGQVDYCELYRRRRPSALGRDLDASGFAEAEGQRVIVAHSGESLENLDSALTGSRARWRQLALIVPSERVAELAVQLGYSEIYTAHNAGEQAVLKCLNQVKNRVAN